MKMSLMNRRGGEGLADQTTTAQPKYHVAGNIGGN